MKAAVLRAFNQPLEVMEVTRPEVGKKVSAHKGEKVKKPETMHT